MKNKKIALEWFARAKSDLDYARAGEKETDQHHITCYLCHQSAEKVLKGLILGAGALPPKTHNLRTLLKEAMNVEPALGTFQKEINRLDSFYIGSRYPGPIEFDFRPEDAEFSIEFAEKLLAFANS